MATIRIWFGADIDPAHKYVFAGGNAKEGVAAYLNSFRFVDISNFNFTKKTPLEASFVFDFSEVWSIAERFDTNTNNATYCHVYNTQTGDAYNIGGYYFITRIEYMNGSVLRFTLKLDTWMTCMVFNEYGSSAQKVDPWVSMLSKTALIERCHVKRFNFDSTNPDYETNYYNIATIRDRISYNLEEPALRSFEPSIGYNEREYKANKVCFTEKSFLLVQCTNAAYKSETKTTIPGGIVLPYTTLISPLSKMKIERTQESGTTLYASWNAIDLYKVAQWGKIKVYYTARDLSGDSPVEMDVVSISVINLPITLVNPSIPVSTDTTKEETFENTYINATRVTIADNRGYSEGNFCQTLAINEFKRLYENANINTEEVMDSLIYPLLPFGYDAEHMEYFYKFSRGDCVGRVKTAENGWSLDNRIYDLKLLNYPYSSFNFITYNKELEDNNIFKALSINDANTPVFHYMTFGNGAIQDLITYWPNNKQYGYLTQYGVGDIDTQGDSLGIANSTYAEYLRNQQTANTTGAVLGTITSALSVGVGVATANPIAIASGVIGGVQTIAGAVEKYESAKNGATNVSRSANNLVFNLQFNTDLPYGWVTKALRDNEMQTIQDYFYYKGYNINRIMKVSDAISSRTFFNYIQTHDKSILGGFSYLGQEIREDLMKILEEGTEIWDARDLHMDDDTSGLNVHSVFLPASSSVLSLEHGNISISQCRGLVENIERDFMNYNY